MGVLAMKRFIGAVLSIFVFWNVVDFFVHGIILKAAYEETASLWRPMEEMKMGLMYLVVLISAMVFVSIYKYLVTKKSMQKAILYSALYGFGASISVGYGSYTVMPIPYTMALIWFLNMFIRTVLAGVLLGLIIKE
jgi:hypothetical protein